MNVTVQSTGSQIATIVWRDRRVGIEYQWVGSDDAAAPIMVFLHEGLGSVAMWKDFPAQLCEATGCRGLVYSRPGYGQSTPRAKDEHWGVDFMHRQAFEVLPALLAAVGVDAANTPLWLFGHSDGASIALLFAARFPAQVRGAVLLAPHTHVEDICITSIEQARETYRSTELPRRLSRYHQNPDSAFWGWNDIWLHPDFRAWTIDAEVATIACPLLAVQGQDDEYGTLEQIERIARHTRQTTLLALPQCGHSPHRDQPESLTEAVCDFFDHHKGDRP